MLNRTKKPALRLPTKDPSSYRGSGLHIRVHDLNALISDFNEIAGILRQQIYEIICKLISFIFESDSPVGRENMCGCHTLTTLSTPPVAMILALVQ